MSNVEPETGNPDPTPDAAPAAPEKDWQAEAEKWKAMSRKNEQAAKEATGKLSEYEEANQSELEKLTKRLTEAETKASASEMDLWRTQVALEKGLTAAQAKRLHGDSLDSLTEDADELLSTFKPPEEKPAATPSGLPIDPQGLERGDDATAGPEPDYDALGAKLASGF